MHLGDEERDGQEDRAGETGTGRAYGPVSQGQKLDFPGPTLGLGTPSLNSA